MLSLHPAITPTPRPPALAFAGSSGLPEMTYTCRRLLLPPPCKPCTFHLTPPHQPARPLPARPYCPPSCARRAPSSTPPLRWASAHLSRPAKHPAPAGQSLLLTPPGKPKPSPPPAPPRRHPVTRPLAGRGEEPPVLPAPRPAPAPTPSRSLSLRPPPPGLSPEHLLTAHPLSLILFWYITPPIRKPTHQTTTTPALTSTYPLCTRPVSQPPPALAALHRGKTPRAHP